MSQWVKFIHPIGAVTTITSRKTAVLRVALALPLVPVMRVSNPLPSAVHIPLGRVALCLDCDACFDLGYQRCPACGSGTWSSMSRFIHAQVEAFGAPCMERAAADITHKAFSGVG